MKKTMNRNIVMRTLIGAGFVLSLTANVAAAGMLSGPHAQNPIASKISAVLGAFADLSPDTREKTIDIVKKGLPDLRAQAAEIRTERAKVLEMLAKPDYKRAEAEKLLADIRTKTAALQEKGQGAALDVADAMSAQERANVVAVLQANFPRLAGQDAAPQK
ncbi:MAG: periplasmic heavy metal sensor [Alphaproteobacteria bacterium]|nr:periplasmic heavy metal sensor [Alphaproteobacteria bacterium]